MKLKPTEHPGILADPKGRFRVILYHPETESRYFLGTYAKIEKAIAVRDAEQKIGGFTTTRKPRQWTPPSEAQDEPPAPATP